MNWKPVDLELGTAIQFLCPHGQPMGSEDCPHCTMAEVLEEEPKLELRATVYKHRTGAVVTPAPCCEALGPPTPRK